MFTKQEKDMITSYISEYIHEKRLRVSTGRKGQRVQDWDMITSYISEYIHPRETPSSFNR
jgi:hypothetical protein